MPDSTLKGLLCALLLASCSGLNRNQVATGRLDFSGGLYRSQEWSEALAFKRYSWFEDLTLAYGLLLAPIDSQSPFQNWFSPAEKEALENCQKSIIVLNYARRPIYQGLFLQQMERWGYTKANLTHFSRHLKAHPSYTYSGLQLYRAYALCFKADGRPHEEGEPTIHFPGFRSIKIKIQAPSVN